MFYEHHHEALTVKVVELDCSENVKGLRQASICEKQQVENVHYKEYCTTRSKTWSMMEEVSLMIMML